MSFRAHGSWTYPGQWRRYHYYHYARPPSYYVFGGWGTGWYDPWWSGTYWWPDGYARQTHSTYNTYNTYDTYGYGGGYGESQPYYADEPWMDGDLREALGDVASAWTLGDVERFQAHLTPGVAVAVRHDWEQERPWVLAAPVLLDIVLQALDSQRESRFRFVRVEEMEPGLVWAVAEHSFRPADGERREARLEFMLRRYDEAWLVEAITGSPAKYWWLDADLLDDAAAESERLLAEMDRAQPTAPE